MEQRCEECETPTNHRCARCKWVYYCSSDCQRVGWITGHREACCDPRDYDATTLCNELGKWLHRTIVECPKSRAQCVAAMARTLGSYAVVLRVNDVPEVRTLMDKGIVNLSILPVDQKHQLKDVPPLSLVAHRYDPKRQFAVVLEVKSWEDSKKQGCDIYATMGFVFGHDAKDDLFAL